MQHELPHNTTLKESGPFIRTSENSITNFFILQVVISVRDMMKGMMSELVNCICDPFMQIRGCLQKIFEGIEWDAVVEE